jgi:hypothetical protein
VSAYKAQLYAESEFEKYRIVQDKLFMSDYDRYLLALEEEVKRNEELGIEDEELGMERENEEV